MKRQNPQTSVECNGRGCLGVLPRISAPKGNLLQYGVFKSFRSAQTYDGLGLDLDSLTGCRVATHTRLTMCLYRAAEPWNYEFARSFRFFYGQLEKFVKERRDLLLGHRLFRSADLFSHVRNDFRFAQRICHRVTFSSSL